MKPGDPVVVFGDTCLPGIIGFAIGLCYIVSLLRAKTLFYLCPCSPGPARCLVPDSSSQGQGGVHEVPNRIRQICAGHGTSGSLERGMRAGHSHYRGLAFLGVTKTSTWMADFGIGNNNANYCRALAICQTLFYVLSSSTHLILRAAGRGRRNLCPHSANGETKALSHQVACRRSHSQKSGETGFRINCV